MSQETVYAARCLWWDDRENAVTGPHGLPSCPHCGSVLHQIDTKEWLDGLKEADRSIPGYEAMLLWSKGRCFTRMRTLQFEYARAFPDRPLVVLDATS